MQHHRAVGVGLLVLCALTGCVSPELKQAHRLAKENKWDQAVTAYQDAQRKAPFDETIQRQLDKAKIAAAADHYALGKLAFENHRLADALQDSITEPTKQQRAAKTISDHFIASSYSNE